MEYCLTIDSLVGRALLAGLFVIGLYFFLKIWAKSEKQKAVSERKG